MRYFFSDLSLDTDRRELRRGDQAIAVEPQVFDLLQFLMAATYADALRAAGVPE